MDKFARWRCREVCLHEVVRRTRREPTLTRAACQGPSSRASAFQAARSAIRSPHSPPLFAHPRDQPGKPILRDDLVELRTVALDDTHAVGHHVDRSQATSALAWQVSVASSMQSPALLAVGQAPPAMLDDNDEGFSVPDVIWSTFERQLLP
jgi:hypothetical protein